MSRQPHIVLLLLLLGSGVILADEARDVEPTPQAVATEAQRQEQAEDSVASKTVRAAGQKDAPKEISGMSILGNQEAPKSLVIVPWKSSEIGDSIGVSTMLDDSRQPVDREVFVRALRYYDIRSGKTP